MTDANGTRNHSNDQPTFGPIPRARYVSAATSAADKASAADKVPDSNLSSKLPTKPPTQPLAKPESATPTRRTRQSEVARQRPADAADKPVTRRTRSRSRRKVGSAADSKLPQRSQTVTSLPLTKTALLGRNGLGRNGSSSKTAAGKSSVSPLKKARRRSPRRKTPATVLWFGKLLIVGLGVAVIGGTLLKSFSRSSNTDAIADSTITNSAETASEKFPIQLNQEVASLKSAFQGLPNSYPGLTPKAFYVDVDTGDYVNLDGSDSIAAASTIKLPILLAFFEEVDAQRIDPNQTLALLPEQIAEGSGDMQLSAPGTQFTALEVATQMIVNSDNTATNMMIDLLGGAALLNERFKGYGLQKTQLISSLPDLDGNNLTSARDLVHTMLLISGDYPAEGLRNTRLTMRSRDRILNILARTRNKSLIPAGLTEQGALTYNKTGDIESVLGDVSLVDLSNGKRYIVAALVERPSNDGRAVDLIQSISASIFKEADSAIQPAVTPLGSPDGANPSAGAATPAPAKPSNGEGTGDGVRDGAEETAVPTTPTSADAEPVNAGSARPIEEEPYPSANP